MPISPRFWSLLLGCALAAPRAAAPQRCASGVRTCAELPAPSPPYTLAIAAAIKSDIPGDANATRAWIEYHRLLGAEHFYLAVNDCHSEATDCLLRSYGRWITREKSLECKEKRSHRHNLQREAYHAMLRAHASEARAWLFIDADECSALLSYALLDYDPAERHAMMRAYDAEFADGKEPGQSPSLRGEPSSLCQ